MNTGLRFKKMRIGLSALAATASMLGGPLLQVAHAADLTALSDTQSRLKQSTLSNHEIKFVTPTGIAFSTTLILTFQSTYNIPAALDFTDIDLAEGDTGNCTTATFTEQTLAGAATGTDTAAVRTDSSIITFSARTASNLITAGRCVRIRIGTNAVSGTTGDQQITNPVTAGTFTIGMSGTFGDTGTISEAIITDDQVVVTATVAQTISFAISDNAIGFGALTSANARYATDDAAGTNTADTAAHTLISATNAVSGYSVTVTGNTLTSSSTGNPTISAIGATGVASTAGFEQYGINLASPTGGSGTASAPYATASMYAFDTASFPDVVASSATASTATTYNVRYLANISAATEAGAYTSTLTYIMTANF